ncbi:MAG: leucyl aminopeptidase, partial [Lachnospiraceae bacterium]|nr:leucyl aminopeptidase [Lachnospiraceae bacterium]
MIEERFELIKERIGLLEIDKEVQSEYAAFFGEIFGFAQMVLETYELIKNGEFYQMSPEDLRKINRSLYEGIFPENYVNSHFNPEYSVKCFGKEMGQFLSFLAAEMRALIGFAFERDLEAMVIRLELLLEIYTSFVTAKEENVPVSVSLLKENAYWFLSDYAKQEGREVIRNQIDPSRDFAKKIIMESDLTDLRYLYYYGEYI